MLEHTADPFVAQVDTTWNADKRYYHYTYANEEDAIRATAFCRQNSPYTYSARIVSPTPATKKAMEIATLAFTIAHEKEQYATTCAKRKKPAMRQ